MDFKQAIIKSMKAYYKGVSPEKLASVSSKKMKYTKKYFDRASKDFGIDPVELDKDEKKKGKGY